MHTAQKNAAMFAANVEQQNKRLVKRREFSLWDALKRTVSQRQQQQQQRQKEQMNYYEIFGFFVQQAHTY